MASPTPNHLKAWRTFRGLTQQQIADAVVPPSTKSVIGALESGKRGLSDKWLRRLAVVLQTTPGFLLDKHPADVPHDLLSLWDDIAPEDRARAIRALEVFRRAS